jgi:hypothetical protein
MRASRPDCVALCCERAIFLSLSRLLGEPVIEHGAREADVPTYSMRRQTASPHGLVDPARLDVEIPSRLFRAKESIRGQ